MEITVLTNSLTRIGVVDVFQSLIWRDKYYSAGDFEIKSDPNTYFLTAMVNGKYLKLDTSEHIMIVNTLRIISDPVNGNQVFVEGPSLESILESRIVWDQTVLTGDFQDAIHQLLDDNAINPSDPDRKISLLEFQASSDPIITALEIENQFWGETLYKVITELCLSRKIGFKITLTTLNKFRFELYSGTDRSEDQFVNPYVQFSPEFENIVNSTYTSTDKFVKTVTLVAGEKGVENSRKTTVVTIPGGGLTDLNRKEMFTDGGSVTRNVPGGVPLTDQQYLDQLIQKGQDELEKNSYIETFEGQADTTQKYIYGTDFFMGDIVQVENEYGQQGRSRIIELIHSQDATGTKIFPSFSAIV